MEVTVDVRRSSHQRAADDNQRIVHRPPLHHPSVWGDFFLGFRPWTPTQCASMKEAEAKKEEVRKTIRDSAADDLPLKLELIDSLQRLGLDYHYTKEIDDLLLGIHGGDDREGRDLHTTALRFYLLRKNGFHVPPDVFEKFRDAGGNIACNGDIKSLLAVYNAAHVRTRGEETLDRAIVSTGELLQLTLEDQPSLCPSILFDQVRHTLETPLFRRPKRVEARRYISVYKKMSTRNEAILELAKMDFRILQSLYCEELKALTVWWKDLQLQDHLSFARDRMVEMHFWMLGVLFEPQHSYGRIMLTKLFTFVSIFDDIYDSYSTLEESKLLTRAMERWDEEAAEQLPGYMKFFYSKVLATVNAIEQDLKLQGRKHAHYVKKLLIDATRCYYKEAEWREEGCAPATVEEHLLFSVPSSCCMHVPCLAFVSMGASSDAIDWAMAYPKIIRASCVVGRVINDIASHERERDQQQRVTSTVEACMEENKYIAKEDAYRKLRELIEESWMDISKERCRRLMPAAPLLETVVDATRMLDFLYKDHADSYTLAHSLKEIVDSIYVDPI
ncbi:(E)-beta-farnesene synthase [Brachypodium distachyon]|uniref:Bradi3g14710 n=1 Tax=Brachypodium distachyon TaxID=15368 RepID=I1I0U4_BRADI|nr:(E)-beta-farnesene synthase [Brachypodium distachyon]KQJ95021.1 hypothetical protein BRADI_3g14710v3 [Brachypodium distachyon]QLR06787.1 Bradi3g14710 [Brachypodium distachyon]|eukprot:XP_003573363.1 (E)-beta-farnesene synthase [Brachypodium distachyon]